MNRVFPTADAGRLRRSRSGALGSFDHRGERFAWSPPPGLRFRRAALDVEAKAHPTAAAMGVRFGLTAEEFLARWTATEATAKAVDQPVLDFVRRQGLARSATDAWAVNATGVWLRAIRHPTHWATVAVVLDEESDGRRAVRRGDDADLVPVTSA